MRPTMNPLRTIPIPMRQSLAEWISQRAEMQRRTDERLSSCNASENQLDRYRERFKQLLTIAKQQAIELDSERRKRLNAENKLQRARSELKDSEKDRRSLKRTLRRASRELNSLRHGSELPAIAKLRRQLDQIQHQVVESFAQEQKLRYRAESSLKTLHKEFESLQQSQTERLPSRRSLINGRVEEERGRRRKAEKENRNLKRKLRHFSRSLNTLRRDYSKSGQRPYTPSSNGAVANHDIIGIVLPNLKLVRDGGSRLTRARDTKQVFDDLMRLNDSPQIMRGERVGSAEPWLEIRPTLTDRIYYRQAKGRGQYLVLIGDKKTQPNDIDWMRKN